MIIQVNTTNLQYEILCESVIGIYSELIKDQQIQVSLRITTSIIASDSKILSSCVQMETLCIVYKVSKLIILQM